jgi:hypothetical protein
VGVRGGEIVHGELEAELDLFGGDE